MPVLDVLHRLRWPLGISIAALVAIFGGTVLGDQASQDIAPFYANVVVPQQHPAASNRLAATDAGQSDPYAANTSTSVVSPVDLSYASATAATTDDGAEPAR